MMMRFAVQMHHSLREVVTGARAEPMASGRDGLVQNRDQQNREEDEPAHGGGDLQIA